MDIDGDDENSSQGLFYDVTPPPSERSQQPAESSSSCLYQQATSADARQRLMSFPTAITLTTCKRKYEPTYPFSTDQKKPAYRESCAFASTSRAPPSVAFSAADQAATDAWHGTFAAFPEQLQLEALSQLISSCSLSNIRHLKKIIEPYFQKDFISLLPKELSLLIVSKLQSRDLAMAAAVCRHWRTVTEDHLLWREKCEEIGFLSRGHYPPILPGPPPPLYARSPYKSLYLKQMRIATKWRRGGVTSNGGDEENEVASFDEDGDDVGGRRFVLKGHDDHVITCLQISGTKVVSGSDDNTLRVWDAQSRMCLHTLNGHTGGVWSSQISEDGRIVVSGSTDRTVRVWSTETGKLLHTLHGHTSTVRCMALCGNILVSGSRDTTLRIWNVSTGSFIDVLNGHVAAIRCVQFDGKRIVSGAYDYTVKVWDVETRRCVHTLAGHTNRVYSLLFDSARQLVVSGSLDTSIRVWDVNTGACLHNLIGHQSLTSGMQLRGNVLVSGNADSTVKVWDVRSGQCIHTLAGPNSHRSAVTSLQFLENGLVVTSSDDGTVKLWDSKLGAFIRDLVRLESGQSGGCIWRLKATASLLVCAVGSRNGTEDTKLILLDFDAAYP